MKIIKQILIIIVTLALGFLIGWRATVLNGNIEVDGNTGYFTVFGQTDEYYID